MHTIKVQNTSVPPLVVDAQAGAITINGVNLLPHEAEAFADALIDCAHKARRRAVSARSGATSEPLTLVFSSPMIVSAKAR